MVISDKTDESIRKDQTQADHNCIMKSLQIVLVMTGIDDKEKYGRDLGGSSESVFDSGVFWKKFSWQIGIGDNFVMGWELLRDKAVCK